MPELTLNEVSEMMDGIAKNRISPKTCAKRGARFLDHENTGWYTRINVENLDLANGLCCVLGQLYGDFDGGVKELELEWFDLRQSIPSIKSEPGFFIGYLGFDVLFSNNDSYKYYKFLTKAWKEEIRTRMKAEMAV